MNDFDFTNKTVCITGATGGIGRELVEGFSQSGARVIAHDETEELLSSIANKDGLTLLAGDLSSHTEVNRMIEELLASKSKIDVLINNAGIEIRKPYEEFSMEEYDRIFEINLRSIFQFTKGIFPLLKKAKMASVINMSSIHQDLAYPTNLVYSMAKAAMGMYSKIVGVEWAAYNIRVNNLAPGAILTDMNRDAIDRIGHEKFSSWIASGRIGSTKDVLQACYFLASDMSSYMTGETLYLDGALSKGLLPYGKTPVMNAMIQDLENKAKEKERK